MLQCIIWKNNVVQYKARVLVSPNSIHEVYTRSMQLKLGNWKPSQHLREDRGKPRKVCRDADCKTIGIQSDF